MFNTGGLAKLCPRGSVDSFSSVGHASHVSSGSGVNVDSATLAPDSFGWKVFSHEPSGMP